MHTLSTTTQLAPNLKYNYDIIPIVKTAKISVQLRMYLLYDVTRVVVFLADSIRVKYNYN